MCYPSHQLNSVCDQLCALLCCNLIVVAACCFLQFTSRSRPQHPCACLCRPPKQLPACQGSFPIYSPLHRISQTLDLSVSPSFLANRYRISLPLFPFIYIFLQRISYLFALSLSIRRVWVLQSNLCANTNELQPWVNLSRNEGLQIHFCAVSLMYCECSFL